ncbi:hypothetical protein [Streptomyces albicerus]|uniref:hypothetical protein n=1 Tax=Streptomyces albicerus TaxID=2569859 RepID=UPI00124BB6C8|nr:hypothetical protein [Streptomyces albicerus]
MRRTFTSTNLVVPLVLLLLGTVFQSAITDGYDRAKSLFKDEEPPLYVSPSREPRTLDSPEPSASTLDPVQSGKEAPSPGPSATGAATVAGDGGNRQPAAREPDIAQGRYADGCPWDFWVVRTPPSELTVPPVVNGSPRLSYKDAADPDETRLRLSIQPRDSRPLVVEKVWIKIVDRKPVPGARQASLVALRGCPAHIPPLEVKGQASLDGGGDSVPVQTTGSQVFPQELRGAQTFHVALTVETRTCDCTWVPVVEWTLNGQTRQTPVRSDGAEFRTIPSQGYWRYTWKPRWVKGENGAMTKEWEKAPYAAEATGG